MELRIDGDRVYLAHHRSVVGLTKLWADPNVMANVGWPQGLGLSSGEVAQLMASYYPVTDPRKENYRLGIYHRETDEFMGETSLGFFGNPVDVEPDLKLLPEFWGQGYGLEVIVLVTKFPFTFTGTVSIKFTPNIQNPRAIRVYEKANYRQTGEVLTWDPPPNMPLARPVTSLVMRLTKEEYLSLFDEES